MNGLRRLWRHRHAWLIMAAGIAASVAAALFAQHENARIAHERLSRIAIDAGEALGQRMRLYQYGLNGARGLVLTTGAERLTPAQFRQYWLGAGLDGDFAGARGFGFVRRVAADAPVPARQPPGGRTGERFVVELIEPLERNRAALGLDLGTEAHGRAAALAAMASGEARITAPLAVTAPDGSARMTFMLLLQVYRGAVTPAPERRSAELVGWICAPLELAATQRQLGGGDGVEAGMTDVSADAAPATIVPLAGAAHASSEQDIYGRRWRLSVRSGADFAAHQHLTAPATVLLAGLLASTALTAMAMLAAASRRRRRQIEAEQARLAAIVDSSLDAIIGKDLDGTITSWNRGAQRMFGYSAAEAIGHSVGALLVPPGLAGEERIVLERLRAGQAVGNIETRRRHKDGHLIDVWVAVAPVRGADGSVTAAAKTVRDITGRKAAQARVLGANTRLESTVASRTAELRALNLLLGSVLDAATEVAIVATDLAGTVTLFNRGAEAMLGHDAAAIVGHASTLLFHDAGEVAARSAELSALEGSPVAGFDAFTLEARRRGAETREWTYVRRDGGRITVSLIVSAMRDEAGRCNGYLGIAIDISARKAAEARLASSLATIEAVLATAATPIITIDAGGAILSYNPAAEQAFGYPAAASAGLHLSALLPELGAAGAPLFLADGAGFPVQMSVGDMRASSSTYVCILTDISEALHQRAQLTAMRDQLVLAAEAAQLGIWSWDIQSGQHTWNDQMFALYQQCPALRGNGLGYRHWEERVHPDDLATAAARLRDGLDGRTSFDQTFRIVRPDGQLRYVQAGGHIERDGAGQPVRVTGINFDVTERMEVLNALRRAKEEADAASEAKSTFLANMSHEIRTPMNAVMGMLQLVQRTALDARQLDYVSKAERAALSLLQLLNDVLDYSKIEAGKLRLDAHPFELDALLRDLAAVLAGNQGTRDVEVMFDIDPRLPRTLVGDRLRLQQVLINLAGNALKFTEQGSVRVAIEQLGRTGAGVSLRISVSDTGIGISPEQQSRIFDGFTQAEASISRRFGGTGLGLVICRRVVELMGGRLTLDSALGRGSCFSFDIVLGEAAGAPAPLPERALKVLVVDDHADAAQALARMVDGLGWTAALADSGEAALALLLAAAGAGAPYELVLINWRMPRDDGLRVAQRIGAAFGAAPPLVIMVTAFGREVLHDQQGDASAAPFADILTKPVTPQLLARAVARARAGPGAAMAPPAAPQSARLAGMRLLLVEDNPLNRQVASELLAGEGALVEAAGDGRAALARLLGGALPDCVLMDLQMPLMDGLEATRQIRATLGPALPVIAMTANASAADRARCLAAGMDDHVGKPIDIEPLVAVLLAHSGRGAARTCAADTAPDLDASGQMDDEPLRQRLARFGNDRALYQRTLAHWPAALAPLLEQLRDADQGAAGAALHALKGLAATLGARGLAARAASAERAVARGELAAGAAFASAAPALVDAALLRLQLPGDGDAIADLPWRPALTGLAALLADGNLRALDVADRLAPHAAAGTPLALLVTHIRALEFDAAAIALGALAAVGEASGAAPER
ncbi:PAS domain S-box protein [Massilia sp. DWR3-1-1]|uniref:PAS domain S-box protein n=1 Tax=Massilia sp. DWR3-1-1 TaxID=2804559 RepID=UPI003CEC5F1B